MSDRTQTRRALLGGALAAPFAAPAILRAAEPATVAVVGFFGIFEDNYTKAVLQPFMRKNPDIKVEFKPVRGSAEATAMLRTQRGSPKVDVAIMDVAVAAQNNREGIFAPLDPSLVPNLARVAPWGRPAGNMGAALTQDVLVLLDAPKRVTKAPATWADLADPAYAGRLGMPITDIRGTVLLALLCRAAGADCKADVDPGLATMKRIAANVQTYEPQPDIYTSIRSGVVDAGIGWNARGQLNQDQSNGEFAAIVPAEGTAPQINTINLVAKAPQGAAAQRFIDYALGAEAQTAFAEALYYGPTNLDATLPPALAARIFGDEARRAKQMELDWDWFSRNTNALLQRIRREVVAK